MKKINKCPICNNDNFLKKISCKDYTVSNEIFKIVSCETCGFRFTNPRPKDKEIGEYYKYSQYISHTNNSSGLFNKLYHLVRAFSTGRKVSLLKRITKKGTHLDIGCGTGEFLNACKKSGFITAGIEPSQMARNQAINNFGLRVSEKTDLLEYETSEFDSVSMWHVLEHVSDLNKTISSINRVLNDEGKLIIAVPNYKSWDANYYKEYWAAWDVPIHFWHFSKITIEKLFNQHKLKLIKTKPMLFDSFYVSILSEEFKYGKKNFIKGALIGFISNVLGYITKKGHSSIIYIFEKNSDLKQSKGIYSNTDLQH